MRFESILVALDFSDCSQELLDQAVTLAGPSSRIVLLHVARLPHAVPASATVCTDGGHSTTAEALLRDHAVLRLDAYRAQLLAEGHNVVFDLAEGPVADAILDRAREQSADLIVMGSHGRRGATLALGGSVSQEVIASASCPVLTIRSIHKPTCRARSCDVCLSHLTPELHQLMAEREG